MNHPSIIEAFRKVCAELEAMPPEKVQAIFDDIQSKDKSRCTPDKCHGSCQGMGWCYNCLEFRGELPDDYMEDLMA